MAVDSRGPKNEPAFDENAPINDAAEKTALGVYSALVGNHKVGPDADRLALNGSDVWDGLHYTSVDRTPVSEWRYGQAVGWKPQPAYGSYTTSGVFQPATGWDYSSGGNQNFQLIGDWLVWCYVHITRTGGTITVPTDGNLSNLVIGAVTGAWRPLNTTPLGSGQSGRLGGVNALTDLTFSLVSVAPGNSIVNGDGISFGGLYPRIRGY